MLPQFSNLKRIDFINKDNILKDNLVDIYGKFEYEPEWHESFRDGKLRDEWFVKYPMLFDESDYRMSNNQPSYHFFEWVGAIKIYTDLGWLCLIENYTCYNHPQKRALLKSIVPIEVFNRLTLKKPGGQPVPDLFAYAPDKSDWFLCEVKGDHDKLRATQLELFSSIGQISGKHVQLMKFISK
jgi:hypothetical protein